MSDWILYLLIFVVTVAAIYRVVSSAKSSSTLDIEGKLIWVDKGRDTKPFFNKSFQVLGKPDLMYRTRKGVKAVEYKSRHGTVYLSDIVQAKVAALAARGEGYNVVELLMKTATQEELIQLPKSDKALFKDIEHFIVLTRQAKNGKRMNASPVKRKCFSCAYKHNCDFAIK